MSVRPAAGGWGAEGCTVRFTSARGVVTALSDISLAVPRGQVTAVVGGDGAGKTTLLRVLAGRVIPGSGRVSAPDAHDMGFMPSASGVWRELTVDENLEFVGRAYGVRGARLAARRRTLLERADLLDAADRLSGRLSGGMRQKLGFCLAMIHEPELLILDEPSTGVDPVSRVELWRMIAETAATGRAVVMSTTYLDEAERVASVLVLDGGCALYAGDPRNIGSAVPGCVVRGAAAVAAGQAAWRRGPETHAWFAAEVPAGSEGVADPDMEDAVIALTLAHDARAADPRAAT